MDATRLGQTGLIGWRKKLVDRVAEPVAQRSPLTADQARALFGAVFFVLSVRYVVMTIRNAAKEGRR